MKALHSLFLAAALAPALLFVSAPAHAWGAQGHRLVAEVADARLTPTARAEVDRLLATEPDATLASIAPWADQLRAKDPGLGRRSAGWHYVNIAEDNCHYEAPKHCRNGNCIVEALKAQSAILGDRNLTDGERLQALKFVVHLVGDIHQPMHAGYAHDKGGNDFQLQFGNRGTNLHSLWDSGMLNTRKLDDAGYLPLLQGLRAPKLARQSSPQRDPQTWAEASCRISMQAGVYPAKRKIGDEYTERYRPLAEAQLRLAGENLAQLLNRVLGAR
ncbi:S1/P1 nuclease [Stenotrophomonas maltophilia]|uniref:S1/P1 nuclease n=1 Tax=Stenotrophomonas maltophilia group TaxID=995085 RepID=UPI0007100E0F|nr:S1/P1 nuclease [Stenotrophomonas maltophilia]KRG53936.1 endonuclease [Stenotrophomonas maltophilia]NNH47669.1 S1/P1 nuclease [Stenotrophomonas maltophilia]VEE54503.1 endonuclease [Stenotrophomonas maltophilia]